VTSKADSSPVETTAGSEQRPDHTGVIRGADEAEARSSALTEALARIESLWDVIRANGDTNARLIRERDKARAEVEGSERELDRVRAERDAANAEANRLTGFDKTAALSDPGECCASGRCEVCCPGYVWGRDG